MVNITKKSPDEIKSDILTQLNNGPKSIAEISEAIGSNWLTTEKFLNELKEAGIIFEIISTPKMKVYKSIGDLAFYSLPFSEEIRDRSCALLFAIAGEWRKKGIVPARTMLQKVAIELIEQTEGLKDIPILRFHYGQTLAVRYEPSAKCTPLTLNESQLKKLSELIKEYAGKLAMYAKSKQYQKPGMELYKEKYENLERGFFCFNEENFKNIEKSLLKLSIFYPVELKHSFSLFDKFIYCATILLNLKDKELKKQGFAKIRELFPLIWDAITTEYFLYDAEKFILPAKKELFFQIRDNLINLKLSSISSLILDLESEINSINPIEIEASTDKESLEIRQLFVEGAEEG